MSVSTTTPSKDVPGSRRPITAEAAVVMEASAPYVVVTDHEGQATEHLVTIGASVGVARSDREGSPVVLTSLDVLLKQGDLAMYRAKNHGRGRVEHYAPEMLDRSDAVESTMVQRTMERRLRAAIAADRLHVHYQPLVELPHGRVVGVEALARWDDAELGPVPPDRFIPIAESTGLILDLGRWVLATACRQAAQWAPGAGGEATVSVNVSPLQLREASFTADVAEALRSSGLAPERLCLEITETAAVTNVAETAEQLRQLRDLGVSLALDDFGTGHSSLTLLRRLPVDVVKIDRSFVERVATDAGDAVLVRLLVDAAHSLGLRVCAEGIEREDQARQLVAMGCDLAQGWLFGRPTTAHALETAWTSAGNQGTHLDLDRPPPVALTGNDDLVVVTSPELVTTYISSTCRTILGWMPAEVVGTSLAGLVDPGQPVGDMTIRVPHRDGGDRWLRGTLQRLHDPGGAVQELLGVFTDVTEAIRHERALAESEELFRHAFSGAPIGMSLTTMDGRILRANTALAELVGREVGELLGMRVEEITHPDDVPADRDNLLSLVAGRSTAHQVRKRYRHADGHDVPVVVHAATVAGADGLPACVAAHVLPG